MQKSLLLALWRMSLILPSLAAHDAATKALCADQPLDLVFAFDGSTSLRTGSFRQILEFMYSAVGSMNIDPTKVRAGLVQWSDETWVHVPLAGLSKSQVLDKICPSGVCKSCYVCDYPLPADLNTGRKGCDVTRLDFLGDGLCDADYYTFNGPECGYDHGDCCSSTCVGLNCNISPKTCIDPAVGGTAGKFARWAETVNGLMDLVGMPDCQPSTLCTLRNTYYLDDVFYANMCPRSTSNCCYESGLCTIPQLLGGTFADLGLSAAGNQFTSFGRAGVRKIMVFITDGVFRDLAAALSPSLALQAAGVSIIGIGVGPDADMAQISAISSPGFTFHLDSTSNFVNFIQPLLDTTCTIVLTSQTPSVTRTTTPTASITRLFTVSRSPSPSPSLTSVGTSGQLCGDVVFAFDGSSNVGSAEFLQSLQLVYNAISGLTASQVRVGVVQWARYGWAHLPLGLRTKTSALSALCPSGVCNSLCYLCDYPVIPDINTGRQGCVVTLSSFLNDGFCDPDFMEYNSPECGFDRGDCCTETCVGPNCNVRLDLFPKVCIDPAHGNQGVLGRWGQFITDMDLTAKPCCVPGDSCTQTNVYFNDPSGSTIHTTGRCPTTQSCCCYEKGACAVPQLLDSTDADMGLKMAATELTARGVANTPKVVVLVSKGKFSSLSRAQTQSSSLLASGVKIVGVTVGNSPLITDVAAVSSPGLVFASTASASLITTLNTLLADRCSATPTPSVTATKSKSPTSTPTSSASATPSKTPTNSQTSTKTSTVTPTRSVTTTATQSATKSPTLTSSPSKTQTPTRTPSSSLTGSISLSATPTNTPSHTASVSASPSSSRTVSPTASASLSISLSATSSSTQSSTRSPTQTSTRTASPSVTPSSSISATATSTASLSINASPSNTPTVTATASQTLSDTPSSTHTPSATVTASLTSSLTASATASVSQTPTASATSSATLTPTQSVTVSRSESPTLTSTATSSQTQTPTPTLTASETESLSGSATPTLTSTASQTTSATSSESSSASLSQSASESETPSHSAVESPSNSLSPTHSASLSNSNSESPSAALSVSNTGSSIPTASSSSSQSLTPIATPSESTTVSTSPSVDPVKAAGGGQSNIVVIASSVGVAGAALAALAAYKLRPKRVRVPQLQAWPSTEDQELSLVINPMFFQFHQASQEKISKLQDQSAAGSRVSLDMRRLAKIDEVFSPNLHKDPKARLSRNITTADLAFT